MNASLIELHRLVTRRNLTLHCVARAVLDGTAGSGEINRMVAFVRGAETRGRRMAADLGTRLVAIPGRPAALIPEVFLPILPR